MSIGGQIKHAFHHAAHKVEHAADDAAHDAKHDADKVADTAEEAADKVVQQVEDDIKSEVGAAVQKAVHNAWRVMEAALMVATPDSIQVQISFLGFEVDNPKKHIGTMAKYAQHPSFDRAALIGLVKAIGPDTVSITVGAEAVELVITSIDEEIQVQLNYGLKTFLQNAEKLVKSF